MTIGSTPQPGPEPAPRQTAVAGLQWGDEGKGKIVDVLTADHDVIVRYNGGANAGHTVVVEDERYALHHIPAGILYPDKTCVIANGVVVDPVVLLEEIDSLGARGIATGDSLRLSTRAHVVMPYHKMQDGVMESLGEGAGTAIGTTRRGIGPAYADKVSRTTAIRTGDLLRPEHLREKLRLVCPVRSAQIRGLGGDPGTLDPDELTEEYTALGHRLADFMTDTTYLLHDAVAAGRSILFEGANACLLDVDHGTYPYVTSSSATTLGIPSGTGLPAWNLHRVIGVMKAYATRVGAGPFPTELGDETGDRIRERGREYGTTTGRPRRCGWLDLVAVRYSAMICGVRSLAVMLLDVLSGLEELKVCTAYRLPDGSVTDRFLPDGDALEEVEPIYETLEGWEEMIEDTTDRAALPARAQAYLSRIEDLAQVPVEIVSVGPERSQTLACAS